jgi:hypothetical protein
MYYPARMAKVIYLVSDLLFVSKIRETAKQVGVEAESVKDPAALPAASATAQLVILDLRRPDALAILDSLPKHVATVGFIDHELVEVMQAARDKGCRAFAKGKFSTELPALLAAL